MSDLRHWTDSYSDQELLSVGLPCHLDEQCLTSGQHRTHA